jgi:nitrous oxidase accessory protein
MRPLVALLAAAWLAAVPGARASAALTTAGATPVPAAAGSPRLVRVPAAPGAAARALETARPGDTLRLARGVHRGPLTMRVPVVLRGEPGAVVDGGGIGTALTVAAPGAVVEDLEIRASGARVLTTDAGLRVAGAGGVTLRRLAMRDVLYGIHAERAVGLSIEDCRLEGRTPPLREDGEGNGIHLWYTDDARLAGNRVSRFVDGVYLSFANRILVRGNRLRANGRYGLHTMYCQDNRLIENLFERNTAGCAIMFSNHLQVEGNDFVHNRGPRTYGLLLRDCSAGVFRSNRLVDNTVAVFMDNSNRNRFEANLVQDNGWGLLLFASCAGNTVAGNAFLNNDYPVALDMRRSDNRFDDGARGNHWSENAPYDLDGDGVSDVPYSPVGAFAFLSKQYPDLTVLAKSPAVAALGVAERVVPALRPSEIVDRHPLVAPPEVPRSGASATRAAAPPAWPALGGFAALAALGALGLARGRRPA